MEVAYQGAMICTVGYCVAFCTTVPPATKATFRGYVAISSFKYLQNGAFMERGSKMRAPTASGLSV